MLGQLVVPSTVDLTKIGWPLLRLKLTQGAVSRRNRQLNGQLGAIVGRLHRMFVRSALELSFNIPLIPGH